MTAQTPGRGVSGLETPLEGHPGSAEKIATQYAGLTPDETLLTDCPVCIGKVGRFRRYLAALAGAGRLWPESNDWARTLFDQRDAALEAVARVRALHKCSNPPYRDHCTHCLGPWPCETIQALEGP